MEHSWKWLHLLTNLPLMKTAFPPAVYVFCLLTYCSCQKTDVLQIQNAAVNTGSVATDIAAIQPFSISHLFGDNIGSVPASSLTLNRLLF